MVLCKIWHTIDSDGEFGAAGPTRAPTLAITRPLPNEATVFKYFLEIGTEA